MRPAASSGSSRWERLCARVVEAKAESCGANKSWVRFARQLLLPSKWGALAERLSKRVGTGAAWCAALPPEVLIHSLEWTDARDLVALESTRRRIGISAPLQDRLWERMIRRRWPEMSPRRCDRFDSGPRAFFALRTQMDSNIAAVFGALRGAAGASRVSSRWQRLALSVFEDPGPIGAHR